MLSSWLFWEAARLLTLWGKTVYETLGDFFFCGEDSVGLQLYRPDHCSNDPRVSGTSFLAHSSRLWVQVVLQTASLRELTQHLLSSRLTGLSPDERGEWRASSSHMVKHKSDGHG